MAAVSILLNATTLCINVMASVMINHLLTFISIFLMDYCFAYYTRRASQGKSHSAASWATLLILFNSIAMTMVVSDAEYIISAMLGAYAGTYLAVQRDE